MLLTNFMKLMRSYYSKIEMNDAEVFSIALPATRRVVNANFFVRGFHPFRAGLFMLKIKVQLFLCISLLAASCGGGGLCVQSRYEIDCL